MKELLYEWNPWWNKECSFNEVKRDLLNRLTAWVERKEIVAVIGGRRCGKTTLLYELIDWLINNRKVPPENIVFIKADDERANKENLINNALSEYEKWKKPKGRMFIFIDEIQELNDWQKTLKRIYDLEGKNKKIFISGSNASLLREELGHLLAGRNAYFELFPFSFRECLRANNITVSNEDDVIKNKAAIRNTFADYVSFGGYPEVVLERDEKRREELVHYHFDSIIFRDVVKRKKVRNTEKLVRIVDLYLQQISSLVNFSNIAKLVNLTTDSVTEYTKYLEEAYLIFANNVFAESLKKQFINPKKIYCIDTGMRRIVGFTFSQDAGRMEENITFIELKRRGYKTFYWAEKNECDILVSKGKDIIQAIQVCYELTPENREREIKGLIEAMEKFHLKEGTILTDNQTEKITIKEKTINCTPLWRWLIS
ncbi:ATP-binding protein [Candidatus Woesearchaeota archaeon]|nr:ATP-binding protein [Candidatus Woesearchaeota archaeon]